MIKREKYLKKISPFIDKPVIKVITGIRRCGKSTFMRMIINELLEKGIAPSNILFVNKDSFDFEFIKVAVDLHNYVKEYFVGKSGYKYLLVDEVHEISGWEKVLSGFLSDETADLFVSGSNSHLLSSELATYTMSFS